MADVFLDDRVTQWATGWGGEITENKDGRTTGGVKEEN